MTRIKRTEDGKIFLTIEEFCSFAEILDKRTNPDGSHEIYKWLEENGFDVESFMYKHTEIIILPYMEIYI